MIHMYNLYNVLRLHALEQHLFEQGVLSIDKIESETNEAKKNSTVELSKDLFFIVTVFVARNNGLRAGKNRKKRDEGKGSDIENEEKSGSENDRRGKKRKSIRRENEIVTEHIKIIYVEYQNLKNIKLKASQINGCISLQNTKKKESYKMQIQQFNLQLKF